MKKPTNDQVRARINAILTDIEDHSRHLGWLPPEEGDYEAHAILARIESKVRALRNGRGEAEPQSAATGLETGTHDR